MKLIRIVRKPLFFIFLVMIFIIACGGGGGGGTGSIVDGASNNEALGPIIFVTAEDHHGDFANDPNLIGNNWAEKADDFCNNDANKPNEGYYKALLVDGDIRDAVSLSDWVLQPNTEYYRFDGMTLIGETNSDSIFDIHFSDLVNSIDEDFTGIAYAWTGISDTSDFSSDTNTCDGWSSAEQGLFSRIGYWHLTDSSVFSASTTSTCSFHWHFYCVEQP